MKRSGIVVVVCTALVVVACERDAAEEAERETASDRVVAEADDESTAQQRLEPREGPFEGAHDPEEPIEPEGFQKQLLDGICLAYDECRNDQFRAGAFRLLTQSAIFAAEQQGDDEAKEDLETMVRQLRAEGLEVPPRSACDRMFGHLFGGGGMGPQEIERAIEAETTVFDADRAGECVAQFGKPFELCEERQPLDGPPDPQQLMLGMIAHQDALGRHFSVCQEVFEGQLEKGEDCLFGYECRGELTCLRDSDDETGECGEPEQGEGGIAPGAPMGPAETPPGTRAP